MIEQINLKGMSVSRFKRLLRALATDFYFFNEFFFVHRLPLALHSHKQFNASIKQEEINAHFLAKFKNNFKDMNEIKESFSQCGA
jgi:hypothetical protein